MRLENNKKKCKLTRGLKVVLALDVQIVVLALGGAGDRLAAVISAHDFAVRLILLVLAAGVRVIAGESVHAHLDLQHFRTALYEGVGAIKIISARCTIRAPRQLPRSATFPFRLQ